ncbi:MAG TPA: PAS domain S-box protein, partial [Anaerolineae bacterium]|nr:PAS domain S-box protein [Anaerolineae bacterium]
ILNHPETGYFSQEHKALLEAIGGTVATAIKNAHLFNEVSEEQRKLEAILGQSTDAIIAMDESWHILHFNRMAELFFQLEENKVIGKQLHDLPALRPIIEIWENGEGPLQGHEIALDENRTLYATISPIQGVGYAAVLQDITELKRVEEMRLAAERAEKLKAKDTIARYLGPNLAEHVLNNVPGLMAQRQRRHAVVMFADLRDSTRFTRQFEADEVITRYNEFFTRMTEVVYKFEGTIFELTGDELLVAFNAPFDHEDAQVRALQTAVAMHKEFNLLRKELYEELGAGFGMGIGIDQGNVVVGNVGAETRMTFRMVGMAVNVAHRLVEKAADRQIVVSESVFQDIQQSAPDLLAEITFAPFGPVTIKGREESQILYRAEISR